MSGEIETGGPAFPVAGYDGPSNFSPGKTGMTLRDYFAAKAMQGIFASRTPEQCNFVDPHKAALDAYEAADAMLVARGK